MSASPEPNIGLVVAGYGRHYIVEATDGRRLICHPRGKRSDCVVGDRVRWIPTTDAAEEGVIEQIEARRSLLFRQDDWRTKAFAANVDQIMVMVASEPVFSESQLSRALIAAESAGIPAHILLNKADLPAMSVARERLRSYPAMGYSVIEVSLKAQPQEARESLGALIENRVTLVLGPSGAGKSTLINLLAPDAKAQVGEVSRALNSGKHTTTTTQWYWLDGDRHSALIDSPGFQEFGLRQISTEQLALLMPDLRKFASDCKFYNCTHRHEPGCGVRSASERGDISDTRMRIYGEILQELGGTRW